MKLRRILLAGAVLLAAASALWAWYPPARLLALVAIGRSAVCPASQAVKSAAHLEEHKRIKDRILAASRLLKEESGLELWDTPKGPFWIPTGNRYVLPFNLAEMEMRIYGEGETFIHPGDIVLDCGASDGDFTREALRAGAAKVIAIEIAPSNAECIRRNLESEIAAGKVIVYPKGVWDKDDRMTLDVDDTNFAANTVVLRPKNAHPAVEVTLTTIDKIVAELGLPRVDFIKMDIEGAEVRALNGAKETINRFKPRLAITAEHNPNDERDIPEAILRLRRDYRVKCGPCLEHEGYIRADVLYFY